MFADHALCSCGGFSIAVQLNTARSKCIANINIVLLERNTSLSCKNTARRHCAQQIAAAKCHVLFYDFLLLAVFLCVHKFRASLDLDHCQDGVKSAGRLRT